MKSSSSVTHLFAFIKITNRCIFKTNFFFGQHISGIEIELKQTLFHRVHFNNCTVNKFKNGSYFMTKNFTSILFSFYILSNIVSDEFSEIGIKCVQNPEAAIHRCSTKQLFLKVKHLCWSVFCNKVAD